MTFSTLNVEALREDFPLLTNDCAPGLPLVYLDSAATSQKPRAVIQSISSFYENHNANVHRGVYALSEAATADYEAARVKVQKFIGASSRREVIFTRGTTEAINLVANAWGRANLRHGDTVILTEMEHHANIVPWQMLAGELGFTICYVPVLADGTLELERYASLLRRENVRLVGATHSSNVLGTINPVAQMARMAHASGALFLLDAAQSVPHMPVDVGALNVDFMAFSGHKMLGPTGIGVLYGRRALLDAMPPFMGGGDMIARVTLAGCTWNELPYKFEAGTPPIAEAVGLGAAVDYLSAIGMDAIAQHDRELTQYALAGLAELPDISVYGPHAERAAVIAFNVAGVHAHDAAQALDAQGIAVRAGHHCAMPIHQRFDLSASVRTSFYLYNTRAEIDTFISALSNVRAMLEC